MNQQERNVALKKMDKLGLLINKKYEYNELSEEQLKFFGSLGLNLHSTDSVIVNFPNLDYVEWKAKQRKLI